MTSRLLQKVKDLSWNSSELLDVLYPGFGFASKKIDFADGRRKLVLFGCGDFSTYILAALHQRGVTPACFCDNAAEKIGTQVKAIPVLSLADIRREYPSAEILVTTLAYRKEILQQLLAENVSHEHIHLPEVPEPLVYEVASQYWSGFLTPDQHWIQCHASEIRTVHGLLSDEDSRDLFVLRLALATSCLSPSLLEVMASRHTKPAASQYFDPNIDFGAHGKRLDHVFLDAGAFTGDTIDSFLEWTGGHYRKIMAFEPEPQTMRLLKENTSALANVDIVSEVLWSKSGNVPFEIVTARGGSSNVNHSGHGTCTMKAVTIDGLMREESISLIKMDIERAELEALTGGKETIRRCRPMMAICIYHRPSHLLEIPLLLNSLLPNSRMYLRHYASPNPTAEAVLYVLPD